VFCPAFFYLHFDFVIFCHKNIVAKSACKILAKLTTVVNFTNISRAAFAFDKKYLDLIMSLRLNCKSSSSCSDTKCNATVILNIENIRQLLHRIDFYRISLACNKNYEHKLSHEKTTHKMTPVVIFTIIL